MSALQVLQVDLAHGLPPLPDDGHAHRWYLWWRTRPLGVLHLEPWQLPVTTARLARLVADAVAPAVGDLLHPHSAFSASLPYDDDLVGGRALDVQALLDPAVLDHLDAVVLQPAGEPVGARTAAVVVCTRDRPEQLRRCLQSLSTLTRTPDELVVVDNAPRNDETRRVAMALGATYVLEPRPGLSRARDAGVLATSSDVVAFTDDDACVHVEWLGRLLAGFTAPEVMATTGLVLPASLQHAAQRDFEDRIGGFGQGFRAREFGQEWLWRHRRRPAHVWRLGAGANMAFRREAFDRVGGFHPRLGAGAAGCSEDSEIWQRLLAGGWRCRYEPAAVVHHVHRERHDELRAQSKAYLQGHVAALAVQWARTRQLGEPRRVVLTLPRYFARRAVDALVWGETSSTLRSDVLGFAGGLLRIPALLRASPLPLAPASAPSDGPAARAPRRAFVATNPFPHGRSLGSFYAEKMRAIHVVAPSHGVRRVVEVGGGQSGLAAALYPRSSVLTIDTERAFGARRDLYGQGRRSFACADAVRLPIADGSVDVVTLFDVLEHVPDDRAAVREALRVLRPGGHLLVTTPSELWRFPYYAAYRRFTPSQEEILAQWGHVRRGYRVDELDRLVGRAHDAFATFITPVTVIAHDLAFSSLAAPVKRALGLALTPLVASAAALHQPAGVGTEVAVRWTVP